MSTGGIPEVSTDWADVPTKAQIEAAMRPMVEPGLAPRADKLYAPLPEPCNQVWVDVKVDAPVFNEAQLRAFADATHELRVAALLKEKTNG